MDRNNRMSRLSLYPKHAPRQSVFAGTGEFYPGDSTAVCSPYLRECIAAMEDCCSEANESQKILRQGMYDLPRMSKILDSERVFLLTGESTVRKYKADLTDDLEPQINELLSRAEKGLKTLMKQQSMLQTKVENTQQTKSTARSTINTAGMKKLDVRRLQMLVRQREHLEEELNILQAEVDRMQLEAMSKK
ncbi:Spc19-domain-containing protein [Irpex rosettiformis]|uniref:Spc19-domain-containing protein n=1 Tax=Irpex rosettiformis TaxID=378272 RepID=A0ACB8UCT2_9APHY|nr:Spc19-domain-containing protein [Irpex rosettiformis]